MEWKLNLPGRETLRDEVGKELERINNEIKSKKKVIYQIKLPNKMLEDLLFEEARDESGVKYKNFAFFSPHMNLLDLSDLSFDNVNFCLKEYIDLSATSAKIDLTKSYSYKNHELIIKKCGLSHLNLGKYIDFDKEHEKVRVSIENCDLSGNDIKFTNIQIHAVNTNFCGNDFSDITIPADEVDDVFMNCNLLNTGLNISVNKSTDVKNIKSLINSSNFEGCYLGAAVIKSKEHAEELKSYLLYEYETWSEEYIDDVITSIKLQADPCGGRIPGPTHIPPTPKPKGSKKFEASVASFYGCDDAPALPDKDVKKPKTKKLKRPDSNLGSFYGCDN